MNEKREMTRVRDDESERCLEISNLREKDVNVIRDRAILLPVMGW
jgi:hypothetical protein